MVGNEKLFSVAYDYYEKGMTKSEIAKSLGVSHVQVGKYINAALERGLVEIVLNAPDVQQEEKDRMSALFLEHYGLEKLVIVPSAAKESTVHTFVIEGLVRFLLDEYPNESISFGTGMGRFIKEASDYKLRVADKRTKWKILPLMNYDVQDMNIDYYDFLSISEHFSQNWGLSVDKKYRKAASAVLSGEKLRTDFSEYYSTLDFVLGGVGVPFPRNPKLRKALFSPADLEKSKNNELSGDYLNYYFDDRGRILAPSTLGPYSINLDAIRQIRTRIAIASGYEKVGSISSLLKTGLVNVLITDISTARNVLSLSAEADVPPSA